MNKLMLFPITILFILVLYSGFSSSSNSENYTGSYHGRSGDVPVPSFNIWITAAAIVILATALTVGIAAGFNLLGSGFSETSQKMIFNTVLFFGLWAALTVGTMPIFFTSIFMSIIWVALSIMYIIGFADNINSSATGA